MNSIVSSICNAAVLIAVIFSLTYCSTQGDYNSRMREQARARMCVEQDGRWHKPQIADSYCEFMEDDK